MPALAAVIACLLSANAWPLVESVGSNGINARSVHAQNITGKGINIGMLSSGNARAAHEAFVLPNGQRTVFNHDFSGKGVSFTSHDTQIAGIILSRGGAECTGCKGVAPDARLHSARISDGAISASTIERALRELIVNRNCRVIVTGVQLPGASAKPDGTSVWAKLYDYYAGRYDVLFANAAGNGESAVTVFGDGFNGITTGGLALDEQGRWRISGSISNPGPTVDGRRKPELMAPAHRLMLPAASGDAAWAAAGSPRGETSYAAPHTAGAAALLMQRAEQTETPFDNKSLTLKAILVNTADPNLLDKANTPTYPHEIVWHPHRGCGRLNARRALDLLNAGRILPETTLSVASGWAYESIGANERTTYRILAHKGQRLTVTLTWHRKLFRIGTLLFVEESPRFDLRLEIRAPDGAILFSEAGDNNNLRKTALTIPEDGRYAVILHNHTDQPNRTYALAFERIDPPF